MPLSASLQRFFHNLAAPAPPPPLRPRKTDDTQSASLLYGRLPPELRQMVWEWYFRQHAVHIHRVGSKWRARECLVRETWEASALAQRRRRGSVGSVASESGSDAGSEAGGGRGKVTWGVVKGPHFGVCTRPGEMCDCVSLLLACKRVYFETISYLYSETFFDFSHAPATLPTILSRPFAPYVPLISQINITWEHHAPLLFSDAGGGGGSGGAKFGKQEQLWVDVWTTLARMPGLRFLRAEVRLATPHEADEWAELQWGIWRQGPCRVRPLEYFEVVAPWGGGDEEREEALPFVITRVP